MQDACSRFKSNRAGKHHFRLSILQDGLSPTLTRTANVCQNRSANNFTAVKKDQKLPCCCPVFKAALRKLEKEL